MKEEREMEDNQEEKVINDFKMVKGLNPGVISKVG